MELEEINPEFIEEQRMKIKNDFIKNHEFQPDLKHEEIILGNIEKLKKDTHYEFKIHELEEIEKYFKQEIQWKNTNKSKIIFNDEQFNKDFDYFLEQIKNDRENYFEDGQVDYETIADVLYMNLNDNYRDYFY